MSRQKKAKPSEETRRRLSLKARERLLSKQGTLSTVEELIVKGDELIEEDDNYLD